MIHELLTYIKKEVQKETGYKAMVVAKLPGVFELNTAYIIMPQDYNEQFLMTSYSLADFSISIYFVTYSCDATRIDTLSLDVQNGLEKLEKLIRRTLGRGLRSYADEDMEANCSKYRINVSTWQTAGKIPIALRLNTFWKAISKVE